MPLQGIPITADQARTIGQPAVNSPTVTTLPDEVATVTSSGGTATTDNGGTDLSTDATASERASVSTRWLLTNTTTGLVVCVVHAAVNQAIGDLASEINIGFIGSAALDTTDIAVFRPDAGQDTDGNVRVDVGGTDADDQVTYETLDGASHWYSVVLDYDLGQTRFNIDSNPLIDPPDTTISAVPDTVREIGAIIGTGSGDANEAITVRHLQGVFIP